MTLSHCDIVTLNFIREFISLFSNGLKIHQLTESFIIKNDMLAMLSHPEERNYTLKITSNLRRINKISVSIIIKMTTLTH